MQNILTTCVYCGCGCAMYLHVEDGRVTGSYPSRNHPVSKGNLCVKGWHVHDFIHDQTRLTTPLVREDGELRPATWDEALERTTTAFKKILADRGPAGIGILASAKCTNEENYLIQKLARAVFQTNNVDHCARL